MKIRLKLVALAVAVVMSTAGCAIPYLPDFFWQSAPDSGGQQHEQAGLGNPYEPAWNQGAEDVRATLVRYAPKPAGYPTVQPAPGDWTTIDVSEVVLTPGGTPGNPGDEVYALLDFPCAVTGDIVFDITVRWTLTGTETTTAVTSGLHPAITLDGC